MATFGQTQLFLYVRLYAKENVRIYIKQNARIYLFLFAFLTVTDGFSVFQCLSAQFPSFPPTAQPRT